MFFSSFAFAQSSANSPYSRFGIGDVLQNRYTRNMALGGISFGVRNPGQVNFANPASYTSFDTLSFVFETGAVDNYVRTETGSLKQTSNKVSFGYLVFGFPITKYWAGSLGLIPYSNVGYKISSNEYKPYVGNTRYYYEGIGGVNQFYVGNAFKFFKKLSVGFNASFLFGEINQLRTVTFPDSTYFYSVFVNKKTSVNDFKFDFGIQYQLNVKKDWIIVPGIVFSNKTNLTAYNSVLSQTFNSNSTGIFYKDTIQNSSNIKGKIVLPLCYGLGFTVKKSERLLIGVDYAVQNWSDFSFFGHSDSLANSILGAFGLQFIPNPYAAPLWKRMHYRIGARYHKTFLDIHNTQLTDRSLSFGLGFPLRRTKSVINIGFEFGQFGTRNHNLIRELYGRGTLAFSLWDRWFIKRKYD